MCTYDPKPSPQARLLPSPAATAASSARRRTWARWRQWTRARRGGAATARWRGSAAMMRPMSRKAWDDDDYGRMG